MLRGVIIGVRCGNCRNEDICRSKNSLYYCPGYESLYDEEGEFLGRYKNTTGFLGSGYDGVYYWGSRF